MEWKRDHPWEILYSNIQGLATENSRRKIDYLKEKKLQKKIMLLNLTETWLDDNMTNDMNIEGYELIRTDRTERTKGGVAAYINQKFTSKILAQCSNSFCEMLAIEIQPINLI